MPRRQAARRLAVLIGHPPALLKKGRSGETETGSGAINAITLAFMAKEVRT
jgi:hypothetical protein